MKRYLRVYKELLRINFAALLIYRANFINNLMAGMAWTVFVLVQMMLLTSRTKEVFGWKRDEILLLTGAFTLTMGILHMFFTRNFEQLARSVHLGFLDSLLVKPIDSQFLMSLSYINYVHFLRIVLGIVFTLLMVIKLQLSPTLLQYAAFFLYLILGLVILYSIWVFVITLTIWYPRLSNLVDLMFNVTGMARYPSEMYSGTSKVIFIVLLPLLFVVVAPVKTLIQKATYIDMLGLVILSVVLYFGARKFWQFALKYYTSASS